MKKFTTELIIICILWLSIILTLCFNYYFDIFLIIGIIGLTIVTITNKKYVEISLTTLIIILILGTFKLVKFSHTAIEISRLVVI